MHTVILAGEYDYRNRLFALCEKCYWTATILRKMENYKCPICHSQEIALIPLCEDERYEYDFDSKQGLRIRFSVLDNHK